MSGQITRKEIIEDEALKWGDAYAKTVEEAIDKNQQFIKSIVGLKEAAEALRKADGITALKKAQKEANDEAVKGLKVWKEQIQLENQLISTKKKNELATESTNRRLTDERVLLAETNKALKQESRERYGLVGAHERLSRARNEAQKRLADLLSAEKSSTAEITRARLEFEKYEVRLAAVNAATNNYKNSIGNYQSAFKGLNGTLRELMSTFGVVTGLALFGQIVKDIFSVIREFDKQLIAVGKTTGIAGSQLKELGRAVIELGGNLDGISLQGLLQSAEVAGQLGVTGTENILKFSEAVEKLRLTSNIVSEEQIAAFAKFIEVSSDSFDNADRLASVITGLGNAYASTEGEILANATEIQKGIAVYNTSAQGVLGLAAATSTLGSEAEASRSAIQTAFGVINQAVATGENLQEVLKLTGLTEKQLSDQFNKDATGVFLKFVKGLKQSKDEGKNLSVTLGDLGIQEKRAFTVVGSLAANYEVLEGAMKKAGAEYKENTALNKEVEAAAQSIDSVLNDLRDEWEKYILKQNSANEGTEKIVGTLRFLKENLADVINYALKFGSVILTFIGVQKAWNLATTIWNALKAASTAAQLRFAIATGIGTTAMKAEAAAAKEAAAATTALNTATKATPFGLILAIVLSLVAAYDAFATSANSAADAQSRLSQGAERDSAALAESERAFEEYYNKRLKGITDEYDLKAAKQGESKKLDQEEIDSKKKVAENAIAGNEKIIASNARLGEEEKKASAERIRNLETTRARMLAVTDEGQGAAREAAKFAQRQIEQEKSNTAVYLQSLRADSESKKNINKKLNQNLLDLDQQTAVLRASGQREMSDKERREWEKAQKEKYEREKKATADAYKLSQFRLQVQIDANNEFIENEDNFVEERIEAINENEKLVAEQRRKQAIYELQQLGEYNNDKGKFFRQLSDLEIKEIIETGKTKKNLTDEQKLIYEKYQNDLTQTTKSSAKKREEIETQSAERLAKEWEERIKKNLETSQSESKMIEEREIMNLQRLLKQKKISVEDYEKKVSDIRKQYAEANLNDQIQALETELMVLANNSKEAEIIRQALHDLRVKLSNSETDNEIQNREKVKAATRQAILDTSQTLQDSFGINAQVTEQFFNGLINGFKNSAEAAQATFSLIREITRAVFEARIQEIDFEIQREQEKYDRQIELAGDDQRQRDLLTKEAEKKREELEKKKRKEQQKAAIYDKALKITQTAIATALGIMQAYAQLGPIAGSAAAVWVAILGGIQTAAIAAAPIPKAYKLGRKSGPAEDAIVGDGGRAEVISRPDGSNPVITPSQPTLVRLKEKDMVHSSIEDYHLFMRRQSLSGVIDIKRKYDAANTLIYANSHFDSPELLAEMKRNTEAIKNMKFPASPKMPDMSHAIWVAQQKNWRR